MKQIAVVYQVHENIAELLVVQDSMCSGCHSEAGCAACRKKTVKTRAENTLLAKVGDRVEIESSDRRILFYALCVFIAPLLAAAGGYLLADALALGGWGKLLLCVGCMAAVFLLLRLTLNRRAAGRFDIRMNRILADENKIG